METKKMSLENLKGKLSRSEMKNIIAGITYPGDPFTCLPNGSTCYTFTVTQCCNTCGIHGNVCGNP
jgi:hypothetical protein